MVTTFQGRLVYQGDHAVKDAEVRYAIRELAGRNRLFATGTLRTNSTGAFSFTPEANWNPGREVLMILTYPADGQQPMLGAAVDLSPFLMEGEQDLGTVALHGPTPIASGFITTSAGTPIFQATVALAPGNLNAPAESLFGPPPLAMTFTDREGRFSLDSFPSFEDFVLMIDAEGYLVKRIGLGENNLDLHLIVDPAWSVRGTIKMGDRFPSRITMRVMGIDPKQKVPRNYESVDESGAFLLDDRFPPGRYLLVADEITGFRQPFELGPEGGELDLGLFDLANELQVVRIHAADETGESPLFLHAQDAAGDWQGMVKDGVITFLFYGDPPPLYVGGDDTQFTRIDHPVDGMKVLLKPGLPVTFKLKPIPALAPGWGVMATLLSKEPDQPSARRVFTWAVDRGIIKAPFPGRYQCELQAMDFVGVAENAAGGIDGNGVPISPPDSPLQVVIADTNVPQIIQLDIPQEQLDAMERAIAERQE